MTQLRKEAQQLLDQLMESFDAAVSEGLADPSRRDLIERTRRGQIAALENAVRKEVVDWVADERDGVLADDIAARFGAETSNVK